MVEVKEYISSYKKGCLDLVKKYHPDQVENLKPLLDSRESLKLVVFDKKLKALIVGVPVSPEIIHITYACGPGYMHHLYSYSKQYLQLTSYKYVGFYRDGKEGLKLIKIRGEE